MLKPRPNRFIPCRSQYTLHDPLPPSEAQHPSSLRCCSTTTSVAEAPARRWPSIYLLLPPPPTPTLLHAPIGCWSASLPRLWKPPTLAALDLPSTPPPTLTLFHAPSVADPCHIHLRRCPPAPTRPSAPPWHPKWLLVRSKRTGSQPAHQEVR